MRNLFKLYTTLILSITIIQAMAFPCFALEDSYIWSQTVETSANVTNENLSNENMTNENLSDVNISNRNTANNNMANNNMINEKNSSSVQTNSQTDLQSDAVTENNHLNLESESAILIEQQTGQILYAHNIHSQLRPASVTKVMSILLIMEAINNGKISLTDEVPCSENAASMGGSQIWLDPKETLSVDEMLKAICVNSANDCVVAMAEFIAGSEDSFVQLMNDKAKELGMNDTCFKNCHGLDEDGHLTSSYDISIMSRELLTKYPEITKYTTIWMDTLRDGKTRAF